MNTTKIGWYVMYTKPKHEKKIAERLKYSNIEYFLPLTTAMRVWQGRKRYMILPLFPSYIFVKLNSLQSYFESLHIPGVLNYVKSCNQIAQINENIIHKLQTLAANKSEEMAVTFEQFRQGSILTIQAGPLRGHMCEVIQHMGKFKILVRIELLRRNVLVDLPSNCLLSNNPNKVAIAARL